MFDYIRDPMAIYRASFKAIREETDLSGVPEDLQALVLRVVHACARPEIVADMQWSNGAGAAGMAAMAAGKTVLVDAEMVAHGIIKNRLRPGQVVTCSLNHDGVRELSQTLETTRSAAAVEHWVPHLEGAVVAVGNAPTTLFHLLEGIAAKGWPKPAIILGFPVGFIGAAESKEALIQHAGDVPFVTLRGRFGGSALAAAAVNALAAGNEE